MAGNLSNTIAGRVANYLDLHGGAYTVDGACASSLIAVMEGAVKLASGDMNMVICGGVDVSQDPFEVGGFSRVGVLSQGSFMNPFDATSTGFLLGEGCAMVVMKRLDDALRDGDYIYAVLRGWGMSSDGSGGLITPKAGTCPYQSIKKSINQSIEQSTTHTHTQPLPLYHTSFLSSLVLISLFLVTISQ